ncbi:MULTISPECIES: DUF4262 domain-containing protein [unclassified Rhodococcus (in: high G+C Gram-positive bacteria)]|nr:MULTISPECIES: DUF4262 domain-containing protein [unclassified Rhodococcus (in: high G+C Gram-positive bacteria)]KAA0926346.1 DUF4262 domain-containing protein [Rhodococcus sp. ANT_H53B]MDI6627431.1 DUF4262 domain-containing protein [Rhodococcus sp. (in: high G+C Gram-positive bacteria)]MDI9924492.1 DUF4262 domain-containing protein [Rhodococcus sp. IEGM 1341]MDV7988473.1 DUF4262 domain-containing protein [Rhodococcus sp. IEGM 1374]MDV8077667.1 DUF4262 domain-containing protein [Rhodococcus 
MCKMCQGHSVDEYIEGVIRTIDRCGWALQYVESEVDPDGIHPAFCYTVGLTNFGSPEIVLTGRGPHESSRILNSLGASVVSGMLELESGIGCTAAGFDLFTIDVPDCADILYTASDVYGQGCFSAVQAVWKDLEGALPWEGIPSTVVQPILGPVPV